MTISPACFRQDAKIHDSRMAYKQMLQWFVFADIWHRPDYMIFYSLIEVYEIFTVINSFEQQQQQRQ